MASKTVPFHHDFWVVVGTAAPVLLVGSVVVLAGVTNESWKRELRPRPNPKMALIGRGYFVPFWLGLFTCASALFALLLVLVALATDADHGATGQAAVATFLSAALLLFQSVTSATARYSSLVKQRSESYAQYRKRRRAAKRAAKGNRAT